MDRNYRRRTKFEMEDRLLSEKPFVPIKGCILAIHFPYSEKPNLKVEQQNLKRWAVKNRVPVFAYDSTKAFRILDKRHVVVLGLQPAAAEKRELPDAQRQFFKSYFRVSGLTPYWILYSTPARVSQEQNLSVINMLDRKKPDIALKRIYKELKQPDYYDLSRKLKTELHNQKSAPLDDIGQARQTSYKLIDVMRKNKWSVDDFIDHLHTKWYPDS